MANNERSTHAGRKNANEILAAALASGRTIREGAALAGLGESTSYRRAQEPEFQQTVARLRADMISAALGQLADAMAEATTTLRELLNDPTPAIRLRAAVSILEQTLRLREATETESRLRALEDRLAKGEDDGNQKAA